MITCMCGCGNPVRPGRRYVLRHGLRRGLPEGFVMPFRVIDLDEVCALLRGADIDTVAARLGVSADAIPNAARRRGTPEQRAAIARARADSAEAKRTASRDALARRAATVQRDREGRFKSGDAA